MDNNLIFNTCSNDRADQRPDFPLISGDCFGVNIPTIFQEFPGHRQGSDIPTIATGTLTLRRDHPLAGLVGSALPLVR